jgi:C4-dicarboxylate transporter DctQ subunit
MKNLRKTVGVIEKIEEHIVIAAVTLALILCIIQVTFRYFLDFPLGWPEELIRYLIILIVYVGASIAVRKKSHISVDLLATLLPGLKKFLEYTAALSGVVFCFIIIVLGTQFVGSLIESGQIAVTLKIPIYIVYSILPIGGVLLLFHYVLEIIKLFSGSKRFEEKRPSDPIEGKKLISPTTN